MLDNRHSILKKYRKIRAFSIELCKGLKTEDYVIQSMPDISPTKWHLAHVTWFFEIFVLNESGIGHKLFNNHFPLLFNSYYVQAGERWNRPERGLLSRPTVKQVLAYRNYVDEKMEDFILKSNNTIFKKFKTIIEIGINHEQQHQELMLTDIKHVMSLNPMNIGLKKFKSVNASKIKPIEWVQFDEGIRVIGFRNKGFFYDNEKPAHKVYLQPFAIADRLITNAEYIDFIEDNGYSRAELWLSDGFAEVNKNNLKAPLYWRKIDGQWFNYTLSGLRKVNPNEPVCHVSYYEADAFARWYGGRLPTEAEWETSATGIKVNGNFVENGFFHPVPISNQKKGLKQIFGDVWEWTSSAYLPYPGYKIPIGAIGEYNGKFMSGQMVLRGGSCATSKTHIRKTYRNFFYPHQRWQFMGIRIAKDLK